MHFVLWLKKIWSSFQWLQQARRSSLERVTVRSKQGDPRALYDLGERYYDGLGTPQDFKRSFQYFREAAAKGHAPAQTNAGMMLLIGRGTPRDPVEGAKWILMAARQDHPKADQLLETLKKRLTPDQRKEAERRAEIQGQSGISG